MMAGDKVATKPNAENPAMTPEVVTATLGFPSPIFWYSLPGSDDLNAELLRDSEALRSASPGITKSNRRGWHSETDLFRRPEASFNKLCRAIQECVLVST